MSEIDFSRKPPALPAIVAMKCPNCRRGAMFLHKGSFRVRHITSMPDRCAVCGQKFELEVGFYYGTGYVSYALSVALLAVIGVIFGLTYGFSYKDNSIFIFLAVAIAILIFLQPWLMRLSRVLYLWAFVKYGKGTSFQSEA